MKCPYCSCEMEKGMIQSLQELNWRGGEQRKVFTRSFLHKNTVILSKLSMMKGSACLAFNCPRCEKIIIDYANGNADLNETNS